MGRGTTVFIDRPKLGCGGALVLAMLVIGVMALIGAGGYMAVNSATGYVETRAEQKQADRQLAMTLQAQVDEAVAVSEAAIEQAKADQIRAQGEAYASGVTAEAWAYWSKTQADLTAYTVRAIVDSYVFGNEMREFGTTHEQVKARLDRQATRQLFGWFVGICLAFVGMVAAVGVADWLLHRQSTLDAKSSADQLPRKPYFENV